VPPHPSTVGLGCSGARVLVAVDAADAGAGTAKATVSSAVWTIRSSVRHQSMTATRLGKERFGNERMFWWPAVSSLTNCLANRRHDLVRPSTQRDVGRRAIAGREVHESRSTMREYS
jgi:hypothetical protein